MLPQRERSPGGHSGGETPGTIPNPEWAPQKVAGLFGDPALSPPAPMILPGELGGKVGRCRE